MLIITTTAVQAQDPSVLLQKCDNALSACTEYVTQLQDEVSILQEQRDGAVKEMEKEADRSYSPILPWWGWMIVGGVATGVGAKVLGR